MKPLTPPECALPSSMYMDIASIADAVTKVSPISSLDAPRRSLLSSSAAAAEHTARSISASSSGTLSPSMLSAFISMSISVYDIDYLQKAETG